MSITSDLFPDFLLLNWLPDETLFSLVSRQHLLSAEAIASRNSERLFGGIRARAPHDFPNRLATFVERTGGRLRVLMICSPEETSSEQQATVCEKQFTTLDK